MAQKDSIFVQESQDYQTSNNEKHIYEALTYKNNQNYHTNSNDVSIFVAETENFDTQLDKFNADDTVNYSPPRKKIIVDSQNVNSLSPPLFDDSTQEYKHEYNSSPDIKFTNNLCPKSANTNKNTKSSDFNNFHAHEKAVYSSSEPNNISRHLKLQIIGAQINDYDLLNTIDNTQYVDYETRLKMDSCKNSQLILTNPQNRLSNIISHESQTDQPQIDAQTAISTACSNAVDGCACNTRKQLRAKKRKGLVKSGRLSFSQKVTKKVLKKYATQQHSQTTAPATLSSAGNPRFSSVLERLYNDQNGPRTSFRFQEYRDSNVATQNKGKVKKTSDRKSVVTKRTTRSNRSIKQKSALKTPEPVRKNMLTPKTPNDLGVVPLIITSTNSSDAFRQAPTSKTETLPALNAQTNNSGRGKININLAPQSNRLLTYNPSGFHPSTSASPISMQGGGAWDREVKEIYAFVTYYTITKRWLGSQVVEEIKENDIVQEPCLIDSIKVKGLNYTPANVVGRVVERPSSGSRLADISSSVKTADDIQGYKPVRVNPSPSLCNDSALVQFKGDEDASVKTLKQTRLFKTPFRSGPKLSVDAQRATLHQCCAALNVKASPAQMRSLQKMIYGDETELACSPLPINYMRKASIIIASDSNSTVPETMDECIPTSIHENDLTHTGKTKPRISSPRLVINKLPNCKSPAKINKELRVASNEGEDTVINDDDVTKAASSNVSKLKISRLESVIEILDKLKINMVWARWRKNAHLYPGKIVGTTTSRKLGKKTWQKFKVKFVDGDLAVCDACDILLTKRPFHTKSSDVASVVYDILNIEFPHNTPVLANLSTPSDASKNKVWYEECLIINNGSDQNSDGQSPMLCVRRKDDKGLALGKEEVHRISFEQIVLSEGAMKEAGVDMSFLPKLSCLLQDLSVNSDNATTSNSLSESHNSTNKARKDDTSKIDESTAGIYRTPTKLEPGASSCASPPLQGKNETTKAGKGRRGVGTSPSKALAKEATKTDTPNLSILGPLLPEGSQIFKEISFLLTHKPSGSEKGENSASISKSPSIKRATRSKVRLPFSNSNEARNSTSSNSSSSLNEYPTIEFNKQHLIDQINSGEGVVLETFDECLTTTLNSRVICVADSYSRTEKYLKCLAADIPCISHLYIIECCRQNKLLEYENFTLPAGKSILKNCSLSRKKIGNMFNAIKVTFVPANPRSLATDEKLCLSLLQSMRFQVTVSKLILDLKPDLLVAVYKNVALSNKAREQKIPLVCIEWVIQSLIHAELLPYHAHESFYNF